MFTVLVWSLASSPCLGDWPWFLTNCTHVVQVVYLGMAVFTTWKGKHFVVDASSAPEDPWYAQLTGALFTLQVPATFVVAAFYWILVYPSNTYALKPLSVFTHGVNFVVSFLDMWLSRQPFHFSHGLLFCTYACLYALLGLLFWMLGLRTCGEQCSVNDDESTCTIAGDATACVWMTNETPVDATSGYCSGALCGHRLQPGGIHMVSSWWSGVRDSAPCQQHVHRMHR